MKGGIVIPAFLKNLRAERDFIVNSARELKSVRALTGAGLLAALNVIINQFTIFFNQFMRLSFSFLTVGVSGMLYGPFVTGAVGAITDILKFIFHSDGGFYFPGFTFNEFLVGFLYGIILYRKPVTMKRVLAARLSVVCIVSLFLTPLWLSLMYGQAFWAVVAGRIVKIIVMLPIETVMLYFVLKKVSEVKTARVRA